MISPCCIHDTNQINFHEVLLHHLHQPCHIFQHRHITTVVLAEIPMIKCLKHEPVLVNQGQQVIPLIVWVEACCLPLPGHICSVRLEEVVEAGDERSWYFAEMQRLEHGSRVGHNDISVQDFMKLYPSLGAQLWLKVFAQARYDGCSPVREPRVALPRYEIFIVELAFDGVQTVSKCYEVSDLENGIPEYLRCWRELPLAVLVLVFFVEQLAYLLFCFITAASTKLAVRWTMIASSPTTRTKSSSTWPLWRSSITAAVHPKCWQTRLLRLCRTLFKISSYLILTLHSGYRCAFRNFNISFARIMERLSGLIEIPFHRIIFIVHVSPAFGVRYTHLY